MVHGKEVDTGVVKLFERVKATKGTPLAIKLQEFAAENGRGLKIVDLAADPVFAAQVEDILTGAAT